MTKHRTLNVKYSQASGAPRSIGALFLLAGLSFGQSSPYVETRSFPSDSTSHVTSKKRVQTGDVTGDHRLDALILDAGEIWLFADPATSDAQIATGWQATDFVVTHPVPGSGGTSSIFFVDGSGIHILSDYDAGTFTEVSRPSSLWDGALRVVAADLGANGTTDLVGVGSDGSTVVTARAVLDSSPVFTQFAVPSTIHDITTADLVGTSDPEIVVLLSSGMRVYNGDGGLLANLPQALDGGLLGVLREPSFAYDRCVAVFRRGGQTYRWVVDGGLAEAPEALGPLTVNAIATRDADADGDSDLMLFGPMNGGSFLSANQNQRGGGQTFPAGVGVAIGTGPLGRFQQAWPAVDDFDNDGDLDLFFYSASGDDWTFYSNTTIDSSTLVPTIVDGTAVLDDTVYGSVPVSLGLTVTVPGVRGFVEVLVWAQDANATFDNPTLPLPAFQGVFPVGANRTAFPVIDLGDFSTVIDTAFYVDIRSVDADPAQGVITSVGPSDVFACVVGEDIVDELKVFYGVHAGEVELEVMFASSLGGTPVVSFAGREIGSVIIGIPNDGVPPFEVPPTPDEDPTFY